VAPLDADLLAAIRAGERTAFDACYERHAPTLARYAWSRLGARDLVEEVLQETFLTAWRKRTDMRIVDESLLPWLMVVCRNHVNNLQRRRARDRSAPLTTDIAEPERGDELRWIDAELRKLSSMDQAVCRLCLIDGMTYAQAAAVLGSTPGAVGKRLERARARLRVALGEEGAGA
jgi:RNA polymerase sigma factor (sigma-70 family)